MTPSADNNRWHPDVTVAAVVLRAGKLLFVEESAGGELVINQPAGHLEPDESLIEATVRETLEESGWTIAVTSFIGIYQWLSPSGQLYLRFAFAGEPVTHDPERVLDDGIVRALWLDPEELQAEAARHRSPLVWQVVQDFLAGRRYPLHLVQHIG